MLISPLLADAQHTISGIVQDDHKSAVDFAAILLKEDSVILKAEMTNGQGSYQFKDVKAGTYSIIVTNLNYTTASISDIHISHDTAIGIVLYRSSRDLKGIEVKAALPVIQRKPDRLLFNPSALIGSVGNNAYEMVKKAPSVYADGNGNISIKGLSGAGVMINGRLLTLSAEQVMDYLKSLPAEEIARIEIITNPGAKYDAEGLSGLLNIVLKKNVKQGLNGNAAAYYEQTNYPKYGGSVNANYRNGKMNVFGSSSVRNGRYYKEENIDNIYSRNADPYLYYEKGEVIRNQQSYLNKIGIDYDISEGSVLGLRIENNTASRNGSQHNQSTFQKHTGSSVDSFYSTNIGLNSNSNNFSANVSYTSKLDTLGQSLSFDLDYANFYQPRLQASTHTITLNGGGQPSGDDLQFRNNSASKINIYSARMDYTKPLNEKITLEAGGKYYHIETDNHLDFDTYQSGLWTLEIDKSNYFKYAEKNIAFYVNGTVQLSNQWSVQGGLRNENTFLKGISGNKTVNLPGNYSKLFPSVFIQYAQSDNHQFSISYTKRIGRPDYNNLNPFRYYTNPNSYIEGNPFLQPAATNSFDFSYTLQQKYYFNLFSYLTRGQITQVPVLDATANSYKYVYVNLDNSYNAGFTAYLPISIRPWWQSAVNVIIGWNGVNSDINGTAYRYDNFNWQAICNNQFIVSKKRKINAELNFLYQPAGSSQGLFVLGRVMDMSAGARKVFKGDNASLAINFTDILNAAYVTATVDKPDQYSRIYGNYDRRGVRLAFSYKFGKKTIQKSRDKASAIDDELKRISK